jgi:hypothetical protein
MPAKPKLGQNFLVDSEAIQRRWPPAPPAC